MRKSTSKLSSYEKEILEPLKTIKYFTILTIIVNLLFPTYKPSILGFANPVTYLFILVHVVSYYSCLGYLKNFLPIIPLALMRVIQGLYFLRSSSIYIVALVVLSVFDIILCALVSTDKSRFEYIELDEGED